MFPTFRLFYKTEHQRYMMNFISSTKLNRIHDDRRKAPSIKFNLWWTLYQNECVAVIILSMTETSLT